MKRGTYVWVRMGMLDGKQYWRSGTILREGRSKTTHVVCHGGTWPYVYAVKNTHLREWKPEDGYAAERFFAETACDQAQADDPVQNPSENQGILSDNDKISEKSSTFPENVL